MVKKLVYGPIFRAVLFGFSAVSPSYRNTCPIPYSSPSHLHCILSSDGFIAFVIVSYYYPYLSMLLLVAILKVGIIHQCLRKSLPLLQFPQLFLISIRSYHSISCQYPEQQTGRKLHLIADHLVRIIKCCNITSWPWIIFLRTIDSDAQTRLYLKKHCKKVYDWAFK